MPRRDKEPPRGTSAEPVRYVLPYYETLPKWFGEFGLGCTQEIDVVVVTSKFLEMGQHVSTSLPNLMHIIRVTTMPEKYEAQMQQLIVKYIFDSLRHTCDWQL